MSASAFSGGEFVTDKRQLIENMEEGLTPKPQWRIGTEHEKLVFRTEDFQPVPYEGERGIKEILTRMTRFGWQPVFEDGNIIALSGEDHTSITLEPGGQFELSGAPLASVHQTCNEVHEHLRQVREVCDELGLGMIGLGCSPNWDIEDIDWMPKERYRIMHKREKDLHEFGRHKMGFICSVQVNLDYESEADMVQKLRVALALQPIATALFATSPFLNGKPKGCMSFRDYLGHDVDKERYGTIPFLFEEGMGFERYVDYALDTPLYFIFRDGKYINATGHSFRDFMQGKLALLPGELPSMADWENHLTTLWPQVRIKRYMEMRGADAGPWNRICALPAFWVGLFYETEALDAAYDLIKDWTREEYDYLHANIYRDGLRLPFRDGTIQDVAKRVVEISLRGLEIRGRTNGWNQNEQVFLDPLVESVESGRTLADVFLERYHNEWGGNINKIFEEFAY